MENKNSNEAFEQFKAGLAMIELARFTADKKLATQLTKEGMSKVGGAAKSYSDDPDWWCGTPPIPWRGPWPRPNWKELLGENSKRRFEKTEVLGIMESVRLETSSLKIGNELKTFSKDLLTQIR